MKPELAVSLTAAVIIHALLIFTIRFEPAKPAAKSEDGPPMNVSLLDAAPASALPKVDAAAVPIPVPEPPVPDVNPVPEPAPGPMPDVISPAPEQESPPVLAAATNSPAPGPKAKQRPTSSSSSRRAATSSSSSTLAQSSGNKPGAPPNSLPRYRSNPRPEYPADARRMRKEGLVMLGVKVSAEGRAIDVTLKKSSGVSSLDEAAIRAVRRWTFDPATVGGIPVASEVDVPVRFALEQARR